MRAIFINRFFYPDHSATSQMLSDLAFGLAERGVRVTVITSRLAYTNKGGKNASFETINGVEIQRIWTTRFGRSHLIARSIDYLTFYLSSIYVLSRITARGDVIVAMTDPPMLAVIAAPIAKLHGAFLVTWLQDMFPEIAQVLGVGKRLGQFSFSLLRWLRDISLRRADMNVAIGCLMAKRLCQTNIPTGRICVIPNWADTDNVTPIGHDDNGLRSEWNLSGHFVVGYSGNLGRAHDIETLLNAISMTESSNVAPGPRSVRWLFIGGGHGFECLKREAKRRNFQSVQFRPYQRRENLSQSLSAADAHIVTLKPELEGLIVPSKFYGIAAAGRPILFIGAEDGESAHLIERHQCGITITNGDSTALVAAVRSLAQNPEHSHDMGLRARKACRKHYNKTRALDAWTQMLAEIITSESRSLPGVTPDYSAWKPEHPYSE